MNIATQLQQNNGTSLLDDRAIIFTKDCSNLASIYEDQVSLCIWTPEQIEATREYTYNLAIKGFQFKKVVSAENAFSSLSSLPEGLGQIETKQWIVELVEMYATLFGLEHVGVRIAGRTSPMCPRFHVDHVPTRLIHVLYGEGSDLFSDPQYFRGKKYNESTLNHWIKRAEINDQPFVQQAPEGSVVIMKGTRWSENCHPVIHRSPKHDRSRLVITIDFV